MSTKVSSSVNYQSRFYRSRANVYTYFIILLQFVNQRNEFQGIKYFFSAALP